VTSDLLLLTTICYMWRMYDSIQWNLFNCDLECDVTVYCMDIVHLLYIGVQCFCRLRSSMSNGRGRPSLQPLHWTKLNRNSNLYQQRNMTRLVVLQHSVAVKEYDEVSSATAFTISEGIWQG